MTKVLVMYLCTPKADDHDDADEDDDDDDDDDDFNLFS